MMAETEPDRADADEPMPELDKRLAARLGAVQALYQMDMSEQGAEAVIREYEDHRLGRVVDGQQYSEADYPLFEDIVRGVVADQVRIDKTVNAVLQSGWKLSRLDSIIRAILRAGAYELLDRHDIPPKVVINEYLNVAHAFFDGDEPAYVNGVLDRIARDQGLTGG